mgnify:CR=1 FL=1
MAENEAPVDRAPELAEFLMAVEFPTLADIIAVAALRWPKMTMREFARALSIAGEIAAVENIERESRGDGENGRR